jgi:hypothetical protein
MLSRAAIQGAFIARFHHGELKSQFTVGQLDKIEAELRTKLPASYREFACRYGAAFAPSILGEIVKKDSDHPDVQNFFGPKEVIDDTKCYWSGGMPEDIIGFASDCMGNMFGFKRESKVLDDAPVVFFDHDFVDAAEVAPSFDAFLNWYVEHLTGRIEP